MHPITIDKTSYIGYTERMKETGSLGQIACVLGQAYEKHDSRKAQQKPDKLSVLLLRAKEGIFHLITDQNSFVNYGFILGLLDALEVIMSDGASFATADEKPDRATYFTDMYVAVQKAKTLIESPDTEGPKTRLRTKTLNAFLATMSTNDFVS